MQQFDGTIYQQIVGVPMGVRFAQVIADLFSYCYERVFRSPLHKSKQILVDLKNEFNDTSGYLDDKPILR